MKLSLACLALAAAMALAEEDPRAKVPLCDQDQLVNVGSTMKTNPRKLQCQEQLKYKEMVQPEDPKALCDRTACTVALQQLYVQLPDCRFKDWTIRYDVGLLLKNCGIVPPNSTDTIVDNGGSLPSATKPAVPVLPTGSGSGAGAPSFAPIGAPTPAPELKTVAPAPPVPTATQKSAGAVATAAVTVFAVASVAATWSL
ncbi:hypothetical protein P43SY_005396 [Pythium insidiosum]|uniref:Elicitin-like protein n=1 Tax=Pythium insidiosum TaxID=114742 RepID=A0AAD5LCK1_PYTIN|nr:hypothetical protein P43SY_005396 [Pythium insidiosum]KAJ0404163.1 hypothetical protein ATCC90586_008614 [Pythium insidiosum]